VNSVGAVCENVNEWVGISDIPLLREEGSSRHQDKWREATLFGADGVVAHKPCCGNAFRNLRASRHFFYWRSHPSSVSEKGIIRLIHTRFVDSEKARGHRPRLQAAWRLAL